MTTDSSSKSAGQLFSPVPHLSMDTYGDYCEASQMPKVCAREVFDERPRNRSSPDEGSQAPATVAPLWANVPADILGTVLRLLPCAADRAGVRSVCRHWRAAGRIQMLPAPLPVLVLVPPRLRFSCLTSDGSLTVPRRALMNPVELAGDDVLILGSCDEWLVASRHSKIDECFLMHAFSSEVVHLPCLQQSPFIYNWLDESRSPLRVQGFVNGTKEQESWVVLCNAVLSASPSSGSKYIVATLCYRMYVPGLALWQPGMTSWYLCQSPRISINDDLAFYQGKLYMVSKCTPDIFAFELREDEHGVSLSSPEKYKIDPLIIPPNPPMRCNMVVWRGKLLLIVRFFGMQSEPCRVEVFALDFSTSTCGVSQIHNFDGDCIFVQKNVCCPFSAGLHVGVQGDLIYFSDGRIQDGFPPVYNMKDGTMRHLAAGLLEDCIDFPFWIFPTS